MVFEPLADGVGFVRRHIPSRLGRPHFNFIMVHYTYMIAMSLAISVILFGSGNLDYIDSLFFGAGAATQSGLNTVDVNKLLLYQQIALMLTACVCNPIFINTIVVFVRLYWFEKRFRHVVKEARDNRRSRSRSFSRSKSQMVGDANLGEVEKSVAGKPIKVLHNTTTPGKMRGSVNGTSGQKMAEAQRVFAEKFGVKQNNESVSITARGESSSSSNGESSKAEDIPMQELAPPPKRQDSDETQGTPESPWLGLNPRLSRDIMFADEVSSPGNTQPPPLAKVPEHEDDAKENKHIKFLEKQQRNAQTQEGTLRIPGPRDFDRGEIPKEVDEDENELHRPMTRNTMAPAETDDERMKRVAEKIAATNTDEHPRRGITIDEPDHPGRQAQEQDEEQDEGTGIYRIVSKVKRTFSQKRGRSLNNRSGSIARTFSSMTSARGAKDLDPMPYLSWEATTGRNSAFVNLTEEQRDELGGIEYRSLKTLAKVLIIYYVGFHLLAMVVLLPWITNKPQYKQILNEDGVSPAWWGVFTPASMFNDLGFTLTPDSMVSFQTSTLALFFGSFLIIIGNTGFPCMLRFMIWVGYKFSTEGSPLWEELRFLLDHPRRCFTLLFPSKATWWLFWILVLLNGVDLILFVILDLNDETVTSLPPGFRVLDGWFQATSTRTAGFSCVNLADLHPAIQVSYMIMMYISVFPIAISVRRTNVYEEKSLGLWGGEDDTSPEGEQSYVATHLRRQLSFDLWYVFLGFFIICIVEGGRLSDTTKYAFTMFSVLFEIVSAYGTVGLSLGYPGVNTSFSGQFHVVSKLVIVAMMIRGRHRGLPYALDRAILLPSENLQKNDEALSGTLTRRGSNLDGVSEYGAGDMNGEDDRPVVDRAVTDGAGPGSPDFKLRRRGSMATNASGISNYNTTGLGERKKKHERSRSLGAVIAGGLSAGPTLPNKQE